MTSPKSSSTKMGAEFVLKIPVKTLRIMEKFAVQHKSSVKQLVVSQLSGFNSVEEGTITCEFKK